MKFLIEQTIKYEVEAENYEKAINNCKTKNTKSIKATPIDANGNLMIETTNHDTFETTWYSPSCKYGCEDCILDPEYIKNTYPSWYKELKCPTSCKDCIDANMYDDEDK